MLIYKIRKNSNKRKIIMAEKNDPVIVTLNNSIDFITEQIKKLSKEYIDSKDRIAKLRKEITKLEADKTQIYNRMKREAYEEVHKTKLVDEKQIIAEAQSKAEKIIADAKSKAYAETKRIVDERKQKIKMIETNNIMTDAKTLQYKEMLEFAKEDFEDWKHMEQMIRQHKRNFADRYNDMMETIKELQSCISNIDEEGKLWKTGKSGHLYNKLLKQDLEKSMTKILKWEVSKFISILN